MPLSSTEHRNLFQILALVPSNKSIDTLLQLCKANVSELNTIIYFRSLNLARNPADAKLELESNGKKSNVGSQGVIFVRIETITRKQVGQILTTNTRDDIERGQVDHGSGQPRVDEMIGTISNTIAVEQSDLVQSLETILGKIEVIADVTVSVMDEISKVCMFRLPSLHTDISISRYIRTPMRLGKS